MQAQNGCSINGGSMISYLITAAICFMIFFFAVIGHELGHIIYMEFLGFSPELNIFYQSWRKFGFRVGPKEMYDKLTDRQYFNVNLIGIGIGLVVISVAALVLNDVRYNFLILGYLFGCIKDIKSMSKVWEEHYNANNDDNNSG